MAVLRLLVVFNEKDIIRENIEYYISQGLDTVVLDNFSRDGTYEILKEYEGDGIRWIERFKTNFYDIVKINTLLLQLALNEKEDYFIWADADEIICPFDTKYNLKKFIVDMFNFYDVDAFYSSKLEFYATELKELEKGVSSFNDFKYFTFEKNWKRVIFKKKSNLKTYIDHPYFIDNNGNFLDFKFKEGLFYIKHYPFRSIRQAKRKIFRGGKNAEKGGFNKHYLWYKEDLKNRIVRKREDLIKFSNEHDFFAKLMSSKFPEIEATYHKIYNKFKLVVSDDEE